jgi:hypothetical protein
MDVFTWIESCTADCRFLEGAHSQTWLKILSFLDISLRQITCRMSSRLRCWCIFMLLFHFSSDDMNATMHPVLLKQTQSTPSCPCLILWNPPEMTGQMPPALPPRQVTEETSTTVRRFQRGGLRRHATRNAAAASGRGISTKATERFPGQLRPDGTTPLRSARQRPEFIVACRSRYRSSRAYRDVPFIDVLDGNAGFFLVPDLKTIFSIWNCYPSVVPRCRH